MNTSLRIGNGLLAMVLACGLVACTTTEANPSGSGGTSGGGAGGTTPVGSGGSGGGATGTGDGMGTLCPPPAQVITNFTYVASGTGGSTTEVRFGSSGTLQGGEAYYPPAGSSFPLTVDVTQSNYHITGTIGDYSGFTLYFDNCDRIDASAYKGIKFTVSGSVPQGNALTFTVGSVNNTPTAAWLAANGKTDGKPNSAGKCTPSQTTGNIYYHPGCENSTISVPVTATPTVKEVKWADLTAGTPDASPNPAELTSIAWFFPWTGSGAATYAVDFVIDDLEFIP